MELSCELWDHILTFSQGEWRTDWGTDYINIHMYIYRPYGTVHPNAAACIKTGPNIWKTLNKFNK